MYKVKVSSVNTMRYAGKAKSRFTKSGVISGKLILIQTRKKERTGDSITTKTTP